MEHKKALFKGSRNKNLYLYRWGGVPTIRLGLMAGCIRRKELCFSRIGPLRTSVFNDFWWWGVLMKGARPGLGVSDFELGAKNVLNIPRLKHFTRIQRGISARGEWRSRIETLMSSRVTRSNPRLETSWDRWTGAQAIRRWPEDSFCAVRIRTSGMGGWIALSYWGRGWVWVPIEEEVRYKGLLMIYRCLMGCLDGGKASTGLRRQQKCKLEVTDILRGVFIGRNSSTHPAQRYKIGVNMLSNRNPRMNNRLSGLPRIYFFAQHLSQREEKWKIGI